MSNPSAPVDPAVRALATDVSQLQERVTTLGPVVRFTGMREQIEDNTFDTTVSHLPDLVKTLRTQGYRFEQSLAPTADELMDQWAMLHSSLRRQLEEQATRLKWELDSLTPVLIKLTQLAGNPAKARPLLTQAQSTVSDLESRAKLATADLYDPLTAYKTKVSAFTTHLKQLEWAQTQGDGAVHERMFDLQPDEGVVMAAKAVWARGEDDAPEGLLYLTNLRILFAQRQEVATRKFLGFTTASELVARLLLDIPIEAVEEAVGTKEGFFDRPHIEVTLRSNTPVLHAGFQLLEQDSVAWEGLITRARQGTLM